MRASRILRSALVLLFGGIAIADLAVAQNLAAAQEKYPTRAVRIVIPYPAGGGTDTIARLIGPPPKWSW